MTKKEADIIYIAALKNEQLAVQSKSKRRIQKVQCSDERNGPRMGR